jgi:hypothetical protein
MPFNVIFYIITAILTVIIVVRVVIRKAKPNPGDLLTALSIVISACIVNQPTPAIDQSQWLIRKDYTINGTLLEANPGEGWSNNSLDSNINIRRSFRLHIQFLEAKGTNAIMLYGRETQSRNWWEGMIRFEIGLEKDGARVYYNVWDGTSETEPSPFLTGGFPKPKDGIVIVQFDSQGKHFSILNSRDNAILTADMTQNRNIAKGIFPEGIKLVDLTSGPYSEMKITRLLILEPRE